MKTRAETAEELLTLICELSERVARLERATEMAPYADRIRALREIRDELERGWQRPQP